MGEAYPIELRQRAIRAYEAGEGSMKAIAERFIVGEATFKRWLWRSRDLGHVRPDKKGGGTPSPVERAAVEAIVARLGDATSGEIAAEYNRHRRGAARVHPSTIKRALHRFGYVVKKNADGRPRFFAPT
jgi:transposase